VRRQIEHAPLDRAKKTAAPATPPQARRVPKITEQGPKLMGEQILSDGLRGPLLQKPPPDGLDSLFDPFPLTVRQLSPPHRKLLTKGSPYDRRQQPTPNPQIPLT
jgi:hypothetical protein